MTGIFDPGFSPFSFGFRLHRSAHNAIRKVKQCLEKGYQWAVDLDIEQLFDHINHDMLMARVARKVKDKRIPKLIRLYLQSGVMVNGVKVLTQEGTPQGGLLSPLLTNIFLDDLNGELERRRRKFVRYADDCNIYLKSKRAGQKVMESIAAFLKARLKLKVNKTKNAVTRYVLTRLEGWMRIRLRMCPWKQWEEVHTGYCNLIQLGLSDWQAHTLDNTRKSYWHITGDSMNSVLPKAYWTNQGLMNLTSRYGVMRSSL